MADVRARVWQWDPIGLVDMGAPEDEYDCLIGPVTSSLRRGVTADELTAALDEHVADHFGVTASGTQAFARELVAWHAARLGRETFGDAD